MLPILCLLLLLAFCAICRHLMVHSCLQLQQRSVAAREGSVRAVGAPDKAICMCAQERGNANAQSWSASIEATLGPQWVRLGLRQLSGMLILVYARKQFLVRATRFLSWEPPGVKA